MGRTLTKSSKRKKSNSFDPQRDYLNEAVKDYLRRGGRITKIIYDSEDHNQLGRFPEELPPTNGIITGY